MKGNKLGILLLNMFLIWGFIACQEQTFYPPASQVSLYNIAFEDNANFRLLRIAINRAGLKEMLSAPGDLTFFAPVNQAFSDIGFSEAVIEATSPEILAALIKNHIVHNQFDLTSIPETKEIISLADNKLSLQKIADTAFYVNGGDVTKTSVKATNGTMHVVNRLLVPAKDNLLLTSAAALNLTTGPNMNLTFLAAAINRASQGSTNFTQLLSGSTLYTLFAPNNAAFTAKGYTTIDDIEAEDPEVLGNILKYHILPGYNLSSDLDSVPPVNTFAEAPAYFKRTKSVVTSVFFFNGCSFNRGNANILATNGVIHVLNQIVSPPSTENTLQIISANPDLTFLSAAISRASTQQGDINFTQLLSETAAYTIYAPTDAAFQAAGYNSIEEINAEDPAVLSSILKYHLLKGRYSSGSFANGSSAGTLLKVKNAEGMNVTANITVTVTPSYQVKGVANPASTVVNPADVVTTNGVYNVIFQVLKP